MPLAMFVYIQTITRIHSEWKINSKTKRFSKLKKNKIENNDQSVANGKTGKTEMNKAT